MSPPGQLPHGYTNATARDGAVVAKSYRGPDASRRCDREAAVLSALAGRLPVPPVLGREGASLRLGFLPGAPGQDLIESGLAGPVLRACGDMLRRIHAVDPAQAGLGGERGERGVLVHGDYGPQNALLDAAGERVVGVVDWEWAHTGDAVEDLAWCEWIVRTHHAAHEDALVSFFGAYGWRPSWAERQRAMVAQCRALLALSQRWAPEGPGARLWRRRVRATESWRE